MAFKRVHRAAARRQMVWANFSVSVSAVAANGQTLIGVANAALLALRPFTIVRTRGIIQMESDQSVASERPVVVLGAIIVQEEAVDAGVAALPTPGTETNAPWFVYEPMISSFLFGDATGFIEPGGYSRVFDSKAMRKVEISEDTAVLIEETAGVGALVTLQGRMLIKLH